MTQTARQNPLLLLGATVLLALAAGCNPTPPEKPATPKPESVMPGASAAPAPAMPPATAVAQVSGINGGTVAGTVTFTDMGNGISIEAHLTGLTPGKHGFHVHENGDCSGDGTPAGGHFNPTAAPHAGPDAASMHCGDMGNLIAGPDGTAMLTMVSRHITVDTGTTGVVGRSVIIHDGEDDLTTQPSGNSGKRIGCGVIKLTAGMPAAATAPGASAPAAPAK